MKKKNKKSKPNYSMNSQLKKSLNLACHRMRKEKILVRKTKNNKQKNVYKLSPIKKIKRRITPPMQEVSLILKKGENIMLPSILKKPDLAKEKSQPFFKNFSSIEYKDKKNVKERSLNFSKLTMNLSSINCSFIQKDFNKENNHFSKKFKNAIKSHFVKNYSIDQNLNSFEKKFNRIDTILTVYKIQDKIFQNSFSLIYKVLNKNSNKKYFLKIYQKKRLECFSKRETLKVIKLKTRMN